MHLKLSSAKWRPFCPGGDELNLNTNTHTDADLSCTSLEQSLLVGKNYLINWKKGSLEDMSQHKFKNVNIYPKVGKISWWSKTKNSKAFYQHDSYFSLSFLVSVSPSGGKNLNPKFIYLTVFKGKHRIYQSFISMALRKTAVTPLLMHWSYCSLALSHQYHLTTWRWHPWVSWILHHTVNTSTIVADGLASPGTMTAMAMI